MVIIFSCFISGNFSRMPHKSVLIRHIFKMATQTSSSSSIPPSLCQLRADGRLFSYAEGLRNFYILPILSTSTQKQPLRPSSSPSLPSSSTSSSSSLSSSRREAVVAELRVGTVTGDAECTETKDGLQYKLDLTTNTPISHASKASLLFRIQLFASLWKGGEITNDGKTTFAIPSLDNPRKRWNSSQAIASTSFGTSIFFSVSENGKKIADAFWDVTETVVDEEFEMVQLELEVPLKEWKLQARQFTVDIKFEGWIAKMEPKFLLSDEQVKFFFDEGYVHLDNIIDADMCDNLTRAINHHIGLSSLKAKKDRSKGIKQKQAQEDKKYDGDQTPTLPHILKGVFGNVGNYFPALKHSPLLTDIVNGSKVVDALDRMVGADNLEAVRVGQIALRHPTTLEPSLSRLAAKAAPAIPSAFARAEYHIDGKNDGENSIREGTIGNFTLLVGVFLKDLPKEDSGNLIVYPRTHWKHAAHFKRDGPLSFLKGGEGMPAYFRKDPLLPPPVQLCGKKGDVILCHFLLGHSVSPNYSTDIRYVTYFRVNTSSLLRDKANKRGHDSMVKLWQDWKGMDQLASKQGIEDFYSLGGGKK